jgi:TonB-linked SusC/RagA family outer membrane protein
MNHLLLSFSRLLRLGFVVAAMVATTSLTAQITVDYQNKPIKSILKAIERVSDYRFVYNENLRGLENNASLVVQDVSIEGAMKQLLASTDIGYTIKDENLVVLTVSRQDSPSPAVHGTVKGVDGTPIAGVNVVVKDGTLGTVTNADGSFSIGASPNSTLVFSFLGMVTQEVSVNNRSVIDITMSEALNSLDDVVVIGYGTVKKRDLTGSISSVKTDNIDITSAASIGHALQGMAAGLTVTQNSAQPGGGLNILIRGAGSINAGNAPLYVVDGFPVSTVAESVIGNTTKLNAGSQGVLNFINPADIVSVEVLKDASATAIYGSRAANGVVLITTKRGSEGAPVVDVSATYGIQQYTDVYDILNLKEWMQLRNDATLEQWMFNNSVAPYGYKTMQEAINNPAQGVAYKAPYTDQQIKQAAGKGTDWLDLITRNGSVAQYNASVSGGTPTTRYMVSLNYLDNQGIIKNSRMQRYTGKINFDQDLGKYFKMSVSLNASRNDNSNVPLGGDQFENSGMIRSAVQMSPEVAAQLPDGTYPVNPLRSNEPNPYSLLTVTDRSLTDRLVANGAVTAEPIKNLLLKLNVGVDRSISKRNSYMPVTTLYGALSDGVANIASLFNEQYLTELTANYTFNITDAHRFNLLAGYSYEKFKSESDNLGNYGFITDAFLWNNLNAGAGNKTVGSSASSNKMASFFGRVNYTLMDRYLVTATLRADGASVFAKNHKWGLFPSIAVAWVISDEPFMKFAKKYVDFMKFRVSYGQTGNANIGSNAYAAFSPRFAYRTEDNKPIMGVYPSRLANPDLKWETTTELNIGLDISVLKERVNLTLELYNKVISDLLNYKPLNSYHEITSVMANMGKTQSRGLEITLNTKNIVSKNFQWSTDFTFTAYKDRWLERTDGWKPAVYQSVDDPIRAIFARRAIGIFQTGDTAPAGQPDIRPGDIIIADIDGYARDEAGNPAVDGKGRFIRTGKPDGVIDDADTRLIGTSDPGFMIGFNNRLRWKNVDLGFHFYGMFDRVMTNGTYLAYGVSALDVSRYGTNALRTVLERWTPDNPSTKHPSSFYGESNSYGVGDWFMEKAWFIRLQSLSLGYTLKGDVLKNKVFKSCRLSFDVNNVFVITPYSGLDPETDAYTAAYPNARTYSFAIQLKF